MAEQEERVASGRARVATVLTLPGLGRWSWPGLRGHHFSNCGMGQPRLSCPCPRPGHPERME